MEQKINYVLPAERGFRMQIQKDIRPFLEKAKRERDTLAKWQYLSVRAKKFRTRKKYARKLRRYFEKFPARKRYLYLPSQIIAFGAPYSVKDPPDTLPQGYYWMRTPTNYQTAKAK